MKNYNSIELCYETLDILDFKFTHSPSHPDGGLILYRGVPDFKTGIPSKKYKEIVGYYEESKCEWCNTVYLKKKKSKTTICSENCQNKLRGWYREWKTKAKYINLSNKKNRIKREKEYRVKIKQEKQQQKRQQTIKNRKFIKREKAIKYFELIKKNKKHPLYKNHKNLTPYHQIRKAADDNDYLEVKCSYCDEWFKPTHNQVIKIKSFINGAKTKKFATTFYCCLEHSILLKKELNLIKKEWRLKKELFNTDVEILLLPHLYNVRKYLKNREVKQKTNKYFRQIKGTAKSKKIPKMPTDPDELRLYIANKKKESYEKLRKEDPKEFKLRRLFAYSKVRAKEKDIDHSITREWLNEKTELNICSATGISFDYDTTIQRNPFGPSIDRIDITEGYTPENCRLVIWAFNAGLGHYTEKDLYIICKAYLVLNNIV